HSKADLARFRSDVECGSHRRCLRQTGGCSHWLLARAAARRVAKRRRGSAQTDDNKQPFALVALTTNRPVFMSHEVLEMLVDPQGTLTRAGNSPKSGQGRVEYLIEVCDPCQASRFAYSVNSVMVSDFYTPLTALVALAFFATSSVVAQEDTPVFG